MDKRLVAATKITKNRICLYLVGQPELLDEEGRMRWDIIDKNEHGVEIYTAKGFSQKELDFGLQVNELYEQIQDTKEYNRLCHKRLNGKNGLHFDDIFLEILKKQKGWEDIKIDYIYWSKEEGYSDPECKHLVSVLGYISGEFDKNGERVMFF